MPITFVIIEIFGCFKKENEALSKEVLLQGYKFSTNIHSAKINVTPIIPLIQYDDMISKFPHMLPFKVTSPTMGLYGLVHPPSPRCSSFEYGGMYMAKGVLQCRNLFVSICNYHFRNCIGLGPCFVKKIGDCTQMASEQA